MVKNWFQILKIGQGNTSNDRSGHFTEVTISEIVEKIHQIALEDRRLNLVEISRAINIYKRRAYNI